MSLSAFPTDSKEIVNITFCKVNKAKTRRWILFTNLLLIFEQQFSMYSERLTNPCGGFFGCWYRDANLFTRRVWPTQVYIDWIVTWFQWSELRWLYLDISKSELKVLAYFVHWLVNKCQKIFKTNSMILRKLYGREGKLANCDVTNTYNSFPLQARPFLVRFREALGNRRIFVCWAPQFAQN